MPIKEVTYKSQLAGSVDSFLQEKRTQQNVKSGKGEGDVEFISIIEFVERFKLLPFGLYPVQKFILKLYYNVPLDNTDKNIKITDWMSGKLKYEFTEVEYLRYLYDQRRCNIKEQDDKERHELILVLGRRSGKSAISALISAYEVYKLLSRGHPQSYYGMPSGSEIRLFCIANDKDQASIVYGDVQAHVEAIEYFKASVANSTQTFMRFRTENDRKKYGNEGKSTIVSTFKSSVAKGLRGRGVICAVLDEIAFFQDAGQTGAESIYRAMSPALAQFSPKHPTNRHIPIGPSEGRMILISSPDSKEGFFYRQCQLAMSGGKGASDMLIIQAPTWEVNPTLDRSYYEKEYFKDPKSFTTEHGAEFSDRVRGWIESAEDLSACIDENLTPKTNGSPKEIHFAGVDFGLSGDGTSIALTKLNEGRIELAYHEVWYPKTSWRDSNPHLTSPIVPYGMMLQNVTRLDIDEISEWFLSLSKKFYILKGVFDQWAGPVFEQILHKRGLNQFEMRNFFTNDSSQMYQNFMMLMLNKQIRLYDYPRPEGEGGQRHSPLIQELLELQATHNGKNIMTVEAPKVAGKHDDQSDALARSVLLASEYLQGNPGALSNASRPIPGMNRVLSNGAYFNYHRARARMHGAPSRNAPRIRPR
jgi:hypothetical protein